MEPTSNSKSEESTGVADSSAVAHICRVCHRSIPRTADPQRRESLVHRACLAELQCGITVGGTAGDRRRERDSF